MKKNYFLKNAVLFYILLLSGMTVSSQTLLNEDFTGTTTPVGWTTTSTTSEEYYTWTFYDLYDDMEVAQSYTAPQDEWYITPSLDLSTSSNMYLTFSLWLYGQNNAVIADTYDVNVKVSTDNGLTWDKIWGDDELTASSFQGDFFYDKSISESLASYSGPGFENVKIGFQFTSTGTPSETNYNAAYLMGVKVSADCPNTSFDVMNPDSLNWFPITGFSGTYEIEYGPLNFEQGTGTLVTGLTESSYTFPTAMCSYDAYIRSNCGDQQGTWVKNTFNNLIDKIVNSPTSNSNTVTWVGNTTNYDLEYGPLGFIQGNGTMVNNISGNSYTINDLNPDTKYRIYIRANCGANFGAWRASNFSTTVLSLNENNLIKNLNVYPNPAQNIVNIKTDQFQIDTIELYDLQGRLVLFNNVNTKNYKLNIEQFTNGTYLMKVKSNLESKTVRIIKN